MLNILPRRSTFIGPFVRIVVIFAHSHAATIDKDSWFVDDRIYANTGSVCGGQLTYVETSKLDPDGSGIRVSVYEWTDDGSTKSLGSETLPGRSQ